MQADEAAEEVELPGCGEATIEEWLEQVEGLIESIRTKSLNFYPTSSTVHAACVIALRLHAAGDDRALNIVAEKIRSCSQSSERVSSLYRVTAKRQYLELCYPDLKGSRQS